MDRFLGGLFRVGDDPAPITREQRERASRFANYNWPAAQSIHATWLSNPHNARISADHTAMLARTNARIAAARRQFDYQVALGVATPLTISLGVATAGLSIPTAVALAAGDGAVIGTLSRGSAGEAISARTVMQDGVIGGVTGGLLNLTGRFVVRPLASRFAGIFSSAAESGEFTTFFHGTTAENASLIRTNGIDLSAGRTGTDFGQGFYMTTSREEALMSGGQVAGGRSLDVVEFRVPNAELGKFE